MKQIISKCQQRGCKKIAEHCHNLHPEKKLEGDHRLWQKTHPELFKWLCTMHHAELHGITPKKSELKRLTIFRDRAITIKSALDNQIRGFSRIEYKVPEDWEEAEKWWKDKIKGLEKEIKVALTSQIQDENQDYVAPSIADWLLSIKGISYNTAAKLTSWIDINHSPTISALWRYCGLDATHIKRTKKISKEEAMKFGNPYLKKELLGVLADSFIKQRTPVYRELYDTEKERQMNVKDMTKGHAHRRAIRKMMKIFVSHLWVKWREVENLPTTLPYVIERLGHKNLIKVG